jgi:hypothetical protein
MIFLNSLLTLILKGAKSMPSATNPNPREVPMADMKIDNASSVEVQRYIQENSKTDKAKINHPVLKRCVEKQVDAEQKARQAYDRMYHRHSRT